MLAQLLAAPFPQRQRNQRCRSWRGITGRRGCDAHCTEGAGETSVEELFCGTFEQRAAVVRSMGVPGTMAEHLAAGFDDTLARCVLSSFDPRSNRSWPTRDVASQGRRGVPASRFVPTADPNGPWRCTVGRPSGLLVGLVGSARAWVDVLTLAEAP